METLVDLLREKAATYADRRCLTYRHGTLRDEYTYAEVLDRSLRAAALLRARGVEAGDRVVIWGANRPEWVFGYFGALLLGGIVVPFDVRAQESFLQRVESKTEPRLILAGRAQQEGATLRHAPFVDLDTLAEEVASHPPAGDLPTPGADDTAVLMYTSGTTGEPCPRSSRSSRTSASSPCCRSATSSSR
jgi:long-subunit acyl-CoA synthetase (AMP-forming)